MAFALSLLFPVDVAFDERVIAKEKKDDDPKNGQLTKGAYDDVQFVVVRFSGLKYYKESALAVIRTVMKATRCLL